MRIKESVVSYPEMARLTFKGIPATVLFEAAKAKANGDISDEVLQTIKRAEEVIEFMPDLPYTSIKPVLLVHNICTKPKKVKDIFK